MEKKKHSQATRGDAEESWARRVCNRPDLGQVLIGVKHIEIIKREGNGR